MSQYAEMELALTGQRKALNEMEQLIKNLIAQKISSRPETTLALREVQKASMALGKAKGALGITTPYTHSADPSNKIIEARADVSMIVQPWADDIDEITAVKMLRKDIAEWSNQVEGNMNTFLENRRWQVWAQQAFVSISYSAMWLGMVLNAIQDAKVIEATAALKGELENIQPEQDAQNSPSTELEAPKIDDVKITPTPLKDFLNTINPFKSGPANNDTDK